MFPLNMGRGRPNTYSPGIVPTHPLIILVFLAFVSIRGELALCKYIGLTCW